MSFTQLQATIAHPFSLITILILFCHITYIGKTNFMLVTINFMYKIWVFAQVNI